MSNNKQMIIEARRQIKQNKAIGFKVLPKNITHTKEVIRIKCDELYVNFFIDDIAVLDLKSRWNRSGLVRYITFYDWLLLDRLELRD